MRPGIIKSLYLLALLGPVAVFFLLTDQNVTAVLSDVSVTEVIVFAGLAILTYPLHVLIHELGHLVMGKLSGYRLVEFHSLLFYYSRQQNKISWRPHHRPLLAGQCLMTPPEGGNYEQKPYKGYLYGGILFNLLTALILAASGILLSGPYGFLLVLTGWIPTFLAFQQWIPGRLNDGAYLKLAAAGPRNRRSFFYQLEIYALLNEGITYSRLAPKYFEELNPETDEQNILSDYLYLIAYYRSLELLQFEKADAVLRFLSDPTVSNKSPYRYWILPEKLFCDAVFGRLAEARAVWENIQKTPYLKKIFDSSPHIQVAFSFFVDVNMNRTRKLLEEGLELSELKQKRHAEKEIEKQLLGWFSNYFFEKNNSLLFEKGNLL